MASDTRAVRRYATGLQLVLLVCAGAVSGYLWRAALHPRSTVAPTLLLRGQAPDWMLVSPPAEAARPRVRAQTRQSRAQARQSVHPRIRVRAKQRVSAEHVSRDESRPPLNLKEFIRELQPTPVVVGGCASYHTGLHLKPAKARTTSPAPRRRPAPPVSVARPSAPSPPPVPAAAPAPAAQPAATKPSRPGWGKGDPNHDHTGPPGQSKPDRPKK